jgi:agmatinase/guanidinopropionase
MRLPVSRDLAGIDVAIVGVPYDGGTSFRSGARFGPRSIREMSLLLWGYNNVIGVAPAEILKIVDYGDIEINPVEIIKTMQNIVGESGKILKQGVAMIALGGDHSISLPLLRAHHAQFGPLAVVHFDSHPDTWDTEYPGEPFSHGTPFRRAIEEGLIDRNAYIQVGIRGPVSDATDLESTREMGARIFTIDQVFKVGIPSIIEEIHAIVGTRKLYVSLDIDCVDPAFAPGTGTPEVGGLSSYQILQLVRGLQGLNCVGFDLVEVSPPYDHSGITAILAANLVFEFISLLALSRRGPQPAGEKTGG